MRGPIGFAKCGDIGEFALARKSDAEARHIVLRPEAFDLRTHALFFAAAQGPGSVFYGMARLGKCRTEEASHEGATGKSDHTGIAVDVTSTTLEGPLACVN